MKIVASALLITFSIFIFNIGTLGAAEGNLLGQVTGTGKAEVMTAENDWSAVARSYPVFSETNYRTLDGQLSFMLNDGTRIEVAGQSSIVLRGNVGNYLVELSKGEVAYNVPVGSSLFIKTPTLIINATKGSVSLDGLNTKVISVKGNQTVRTLDGERVMDLFAGATLISPEGEILTGRSADRAIAKTEEGVSEPGSRKRRTIGAILVLGGVAAAAALGLGGAGGSAASPSSP